QGRDIAWSGELVPATFTNTAAYGPLFYLPQVAGIRLLQLAHARLLNGLLAARLLNGLSACLLAALALAIARHGRAIMFAVLLLPMPLFQFASASQAALLIAATLLALALASRAVAAGRRAGLGTFALFLALVVGAAMARPPHAALLLLAPLFLGRRAGPP